MKELTITPWDKFKNKHMAGDKFIPSTQTPALLGYPIPRGVQIKVRLLADTVEIYRGANKLDCGEQLQTEFFDLFMQAGFMLSEVVTFMVQDKNTLKETAEARAKRPNLKDMVTIYNGGFDLCITTNCLEGRTTNESRRMLDKLSDTDSDVCGIEYTLIKDDVDLTTFLDGKFDAYLEPRSNTKQDVFTRYHYIKKDKGIFGITDMTQCTKKYGEVDSITVNFPDGKDTTIRVKCKQTRRTLYELSEQDVSVKAGVEYHGLTGRGQLYRPKCCFIMEDEYA